MVNPDSDLAREHPDWVLQATPGLAHLAAPVRARPREPAVRGVPARAARRPGHRVPSVDYIKWDHNRDLHAALGADGRRAVHAQTLAVYGMLDELRAPAPRRSRSSRCASGGGRVDLGILQRTDRVWASDRNDPIERQRIQRWTRTLLPPELIGTHLGPPSAHTTHRHASLAVPARSTALFGHAGIEWDLTRSDDAELAQVRALAGALPRAAPAAALGRHGARRPRRRRRPAARRGRRMPATTPCSPGCARRRARLGTTVRVPIPGSGPSSTTACASGGEHRRGESASGRRSRVADG